MRVACVWRACGVSRCPRLDALLRYIPLPTVTYRYILLHARTSMLCFVTYRYIPLHTVTCPHLDALLVERIEEILDVRLLDVVLVVRLQLRPGGLRRA